MGGDGNPPAEDVLKPGDAPTAVPPVLPCWADWGVSTPSARRCWCLGRDAPVRHPRKDRVLRRRGVSNLPATQAPRSRNRPFSHASPSPGEGEGEAGEGAGG